MTHHIDLDTLILAHGSHEDRDDGVCLLEAVAWWAGETHTDHPACVSPVLGAFGRPLNDAWPDGKRQELRPLIPLLPGTAGDGHDEARGYLALDWLIRTYTPAWLELAGLTAEADALRGLQPVADMPTAEAAGPAVRQARQKADAAWDAAWDAAGAAAWAAAGVAAGAAAWAAARDAAWAAAGVAAGVAARVAARDAAWAAAWAAAGDAARVAAWDAAWVAAWVAARDAAGAAARDAAWVAAWDAARAAAGDAARDAARAAVRDAARAKLAPTVTTLQDSAIILFRAMITCGEKP